MKKFKQLSIAMLLLFGNGMVCSQNNGFEYIFDIEEPFKVFEEIVELPDGNFVLYDFANGCLCEFSSTGEFLKEKNIKAQVLGRQQSHNTLLHVDNVGNMYIFRAYNPVLDTTAGDYVPGVFDSRITISMLDEDFETTSTINIPVAIDTADWQNIWSDHSYDRVYPRIELGTVIEIENEGYVISFEKLIGETPRHLWGHGLDSTIFYKIDYEGNVLQKNGLEHHKCTRDIRNRNHLLYDEEQDKFYFYMSSEWDAEPKGFIVFKLDNDFNLIEENIMPKTQGYGNYTYHFRDTWNLTDGITLKRTSDHTTILGSSMFLSIRANTYFSAVCMEINDNARVLDSTQFGTMQHVGLFVTHKTSVPAHGSMDWVDENRIFFGYTPNAFGNYFWNLPAEHQYFMLTLLDRNLNTTKELYYTIKADSTFLWVNTLKATSDGGCIIGGHFWNFVDNPIYQEQYLQSVITKFLAEAFDGIDAPHHYGLQIAIAYPNPGNDELNIRTTLQNAVAEVYSLQGQLMCSQPLNDIITSFNTDSWLSGTYLWRVIKDGQVCEHGKWVKM